MENVLYAWITKWADTKVIHSHLLLGLFWFLRSNVPGKNEEIYWTKPKQIKGSDSSWVVKVLSMSKTKWWGAGWDWVWISLGSNFSDSAGVYLAKLTHWHAF